MREKNAVDCVSDAAGCDRRKAREALRSLVDMGYMDDPRVVSEYGRKSGWSKILEILGGFTTYGLSCFRPGVSRFERGGRYVVVTGSVHVEMVDDVVAAREALSRGAAVFDLDEDGRRMEFSAPAVARTPAASEKRPVRPRRRR